MKKITLFLFMAMAAITISAQSTRTIYLDANIWATEDNPVYAVYVWNTGDADAAGYWFEKVEGNIWKADIRDDATSAIFLRKNPNDAEVMTNIWGGWWNRSATAIPADKDLHKITSWSDGDDGLDHGVWSVYGQDDPGQGGEQTDKVILKVFKPASWPKIYAYEWATGKTDADLLGKWPGLELQDLGNGWFGAYVPANANLILNNGSNEQANDYLISASVCLENISNRQDVSVAADCASVPDPQEGGTPVVDPAKDVIIKVLKPEGWASMSIWAWGSKDETFMAQFTAWPGVAMQNLGNGWYQFTVKDDAWFLVNNGDGSEQSQAALTAEPACFTVTAEKNVEGHYAIVNADCPSDTQAIDQIINLPSSRKMIKDGKLIIVRDGVEYNAIGTKL